MEEERNLIIGLDGSIFAAWILTILAAVLCIVYGIYHEYIKKTEDKPEPKESGKKQDMEEQ